MCKFLFDSILLESISECLWELTHRWKALNAVPKLSKLESSRQLLTNKIQNKKPFSSVFSFTCSVLTKFLPLSLSLKVLKIFHIHVLSRLSQVELDNIFIFMRKLKLKPQVFIHCLFCAFWPNRCMCTWEREREREREWEREMLIMQYIDCESLSLSYTPCCWLWRL